MDKGLRKGERIISDKKTKQFLGKGLDIGVIAKYTGLSKEEVKRLMDKII